MTYPATIVIPVLRQKEDWLEKCVASALAQTVTPEVLVVISPQTPARNLETLRKFTRRSTNIRVLQEARRGFAAALNTGIERSVAARVGFLLSDDWLEASAVEDCLPHSADIVSTGLTAYASDGQTPIDSISIRPSMEKFERQPTVERRARYLEHFFMFQRSALLGVGGVDESVGLTGCDDYDLIWSLLESGASVSIVEKQLYNYRDHHAERLTLRPKQQQVRDLCRIFDKHGIHGKRRRELVREHAAWFGQTVKKVLDDLSARG